MRTLRKLSACHLLEVRVEQEQLCPPTSFAAILMACRRRHERRGPTWKGLLRALLGH